MKRRKCIEVLVEDRDTVDIPYSCLRCFVFVNATRLFVNLYLAADGSVSKASHVIYFKLFNYFLR